jgi:hypothetical protein
MSSKTKSKPVKIRDRKPGIKNNLKNKSDTLTGTVRQRVGDAYTRLKNNMSGQSLPANQFYRMGDMNLMPIDNYTMMLYQQNMMKEQQKMMKEQQKIAKKENILYDDDGNPVYPTLELDAFLSANRKRVNRRFKELQDKEGFYFSKGLQAKELQEMKMNEGMHFIGVNINALMDLFGLKLKDTNNNATYGDILSRGKSFKLINEYVDDGDKLDEVKRDKMGFRLDKDRSLMPESVLSEFTAFDKILEEAKKYNLDRQDKLTPSSLYIMVKILDKYKKSDIQWLRCATAIEVIYQYLSSGMTREEFFKLDTKINPYGINELDEFFKTEHLFMTKSEITDYKKKLDFYKYDKDIDTFILNNNSSNSKNTTNTSEKPVVPVQQGVPAQQGKPGVQNRMGQPGMGQPGMRQPGMGQPGMRQLGMRQPSMGQPGMRQPGVGLPGSSMLSSQMPGSRTLGVPY